MIRWNSLSAAVVVVIGAAFVTGSTVPPKPDVIPARFEAKGVTLLGQKTGYFNMAKVMREYKRAINGVAGLHQRRDSMTKNLVGMRAMYLDLQNATKAAAGKPLLVVEQEQMMSGMIMLARQIEDSDRDINRLLNTSATEIITGLYDDIEKTVAEMAREHSLVAVLTYPDATSPQEAQNPMIKELKLKPPALHPFYLDPSVDYTNELIQRLNRNIAANSGDN